MFIPIYLVVFVARDNTRRDMILKALLQLSDRQMHLAKGVYLIQSKHQPSTIQQQIKVALHRKEVLYIFPIQEGWDSVSDRRTIDAIDGLIQWAKTIPLEKPASHHGDSSKATPTST